MIDHEQSFLLHNNVIQRHTYDIFQRTYVHYVIRHCNNTCDIRTHHIHIYNTYICHQLRFRTFPTSSLATLSKPGLSWNVSPFVSAWHIFVWLQGQSQKGRGAMDVFYSTISIGLPAWWLGIRLKSIVRMST